MRSAKASPLHTCPRRYKRESTRLKDTQTAKAAELRSKEMLMDQARDQRPAGGGYGGMGGGYRGNNEPQIDVDELRDDITSLKELLKRVEVRVPLLEIACRGCFVGPEEDSREHMKHGTWDGDVAVNVYRCF